MTPAEYRAQREAMGLTQTQLARKMGVSLRTIQKREANETKITPEAALAIQRLAELMATGGAIIV